MRKLFFISLFISFGKLSIGQDLYRLSFVDTISILDKKILEDSIKSSLSQRNLPPEVVDGLAQSILNNFSVRTQERLISAQSDSTFIILNYSSDGNVHLFKLGNNKFMVKSGELHKFDSSTGGYVSSQIPIDMQTYSATGNKMAVLNYECDEYINKDSSITIWVNKELPSYINPGISVRNIEGAILRFETKRNNSLMSSTVKKLEKIREPS